MFSVHHNYFETCEYLKCRNIFDLFTIAFTKKCFTRLNYLLSHQISSCSNIYLLERIEKLNSDKLYSARCWIYSEYESNFNTVVLNFPTSEIFSPVRNFKNIEMQWSRSKISCFNQHRSAVFLILWSRINWISIKLITWLFYFFHLIKNSFPSENSCIIGI